MKKNLIMLLGALAVLCGLASCSSGTEPDLATKQGINNCFTLYTDAATGVTTAGASTGYSIIINYTKQTCDISITGLALPNGTSYPAVDLTNLPFNLPEDDLLTINAASAQSSISGFSSAPVFTGIKCELRHRMIEETYVPAFVLYFNVAGYEVVSAQPNMFMFGRTVSTGPDNVAFSTDNTGYQISMGAALDKATISLSGAQFIQGMPALDMEFPDVAAHFEGTELILSAESLTPTLKGTPAPGFPITNLKGTIDIAGKSTIEFDCAPRTMEGLFHVVANIDPTGVASTK